MYENWVKFDQITAIVILCELKTNRKSWIEYDWNLIVKLLQLLLGAGISEQRIWTVQYWIWCPGTFYFKNNIFAKIFFMRAQHVLSYHEYYGFTRVTRQRSSLRLQPNLSLLNSPHSTNNLLWSKLYGPTFGPNNLWFLWY